IKSNNFDLNDFYLQLKKMENIGSVEQIVNMIPGASRLNLNKMQYDDRELKKIEAIISSMTMDERNNPNIINGNRRKRIARGSGSQISEVNRLLKQFNQIKNMMKKRKFANNFPFN
ncbi:MAG: signal recognition particle protein, partial [Candidatus Atribacteria bacterium]|nr:signal recognition particle protein [Candidatus Atribacteria bacterium]